MKILLLLVLFCVVYGQERLIRFNETYALWLPESDIQKLAENSPEIHFMDITDYPEPTVYKKRSFIPVNPRHPEVVNVLLPQVDVDNIEEEIAALSWYSTRYYTSQTGVQAVQYWASQYRFYAQGKNYIQVETFDHSWAQPSVIARIIGTQRPEEVVVLGGHIDSTSNGATAPGADDDASGSSTVLEVFRVIADSNWRPERTIEFHAYAAEEVGLRGSQDIAQYYASTGVDVVAMLQFDMTGYVRAGVTPTIGVVTDFVSAPLTEFVRRLVTIYITNGDHPNRSWTNTACGYACSDHASWFRSGYADAFVFESAFSNSNPYIHTPNDQLARLSKPHMQLFGLLGVSFAVELSYEE